MIQLSIIIPHFNSPTQLNVLLKTIPTREEIEVIIIDDNSNVMNEDYNQIKSNYKTYIFLHNDGLNKGAGACRNIGLKTAKGKWVLFADADDYFVNGFFEVISKYFNTNYDVVFFTPTSRDVLTGRTSERHLNYKKLIQNYLKNSNTEALLKLKYNFLVPWSKLINKSFLDKHHIFFDEIIASNDVMFSVKVGHYMETFNANNEIIYCVTKGVGTLTKNTSENIFDSRVQALINYYNFLSKNLSKKHLKKVKQSGRVFIKQAINYRLGIKKAFSTLWLFVLNKVPVFSFHDINIFLIFIQLNKHKQAYNNNKFYYQQNSKRSTNG